MGPIYSVTEYISQGKKATFLVYWLTPSGGSPFIFWLHPHPHHTTPTPGKVQSELARFYTGLYSVVVDFGGQPLLHLVLFTTQRVTNKLKQALLCSCKTSVKSQSVELCSCKILKVCIDLRNFVFVFHNIQCISNGLKRGF